MGTQIHDWLIVAKMQNAELVARSTRAALVVHALHQVDRILDAGGKMTTCAYCRREYSHPPAECAGCGAPVRVMEIQRIREMQNIPIRTPRYDPAFNAASLPNFNPKQAQEDAAIARERAFRGEFELITKRQFDACKALGVTL